MPSANAIAHPNIAFIKYWGNLDHALRLPANSSLSMNLAELQTQTQVTFDPSLAADRLTINDHPVEGPGLQRVSQILDEVRAMAGESARAKVTSSNNFPTGAGIASSAAAFAALALASTAALDLQLSEAELSRLARHGSGSACRSIPGGFVEWRVGSGDADSVAFSIAPANHWNLADCIAVVSGGHKPVGSTEGHQLAPTSPLQAARLADTPRRLDTCRQAVLQRDFDALARIIEQDSDIMHAVMMTSSPALFYWQPATLQVMEAVRTWRQQGLPAAYTIDAGPNVHVITTADSASQIRDRLQQLPGVQRVLVATAGGPAVLVGV